MVYAFCLKSSEGNVWCVMKAKFYVKIADFVLYMKTVISLNMVIGITAASMFQSDRSDRLRLLQCVRYTWEKQGTRWNAVIISAEAICIIKENERSYPVTARNRRRENTDQHINTISLLLFYTSLNRILYSV